MILTRGETNQDVGEYANFYNKYHIIYSFRAALYKHKYINFVLIQISQYQLVMSGFQQELNRNKSD